MKKIIDSIDSMEKAVSTYGILPFFHNIIHGFSIAEMTAPGLLFSDEDGVWEWKGPVIQMQTSAYGKFFDKKAGFVSIELLPDFLNYRRAKYPVAEGSTEELILEIIRENEGLTSTELRKLLNYHPDVAQLPSKDNPAGVKIKRSSLEGPLQRLQMGGWILIADFEYKLTRKGERYGWGVALYSTPEIWFEKTFPVDRLPEESLERIIKQVSSRLQGADPDYIRALLL